MKKWYFCALMMGSSMGIYSMDQELVVPDGAVKHDADWAETIIDFSALKNRSTKVGRMKSDELQALIKQAVAQALQEHDHNRLNQELSTRWGKVMHAYNKCMPITTSTQVLGAIVSIVAVVFVWYH